VPDHPVLPDNPDASELAPPRVLLIAGSDSAGAAGIQADIATCYGLRAHPLSAITALTAQTSRGVLSVNPTAPELLREQLAAVFEDGAPAAVKIGLLAGAAQAEIVVRQLAKLRSQGNRLPVIWDPVMSSSAGGKFSHRTDWMSSLFDSVDIITPNTDEAEYLTGVVIAHPQDMLTAAKHLHDLGAQGVWLKGGHRQFADAPAKHIDLFFWHGQSWWLVQDHVQAVNSRGTGCTLATAMAVFAALLQDKRQHLPLLTLLDAAVLASAYVHQGLKSGYGWQDLPGPLAHSGWPMNFKDYPKVIDRLHWLNINGFADCGGTPLGLYPVVDSLSWLEKLVGLGVETIQLRIKNIPAAQLESLVAKAVAICQGTGCRLFINDYWQLAIKYQAYGVHLGQEDIAEADLSAIQQAGVRLGISTHSEFEWARAASLQPSYLAIGAIYPTETKQVIVVGERKLKRWVSILQEQFPLTAIGGINHDNLDKVLASGIQSVAMVSAITKAADYKQATASLLAAIAAA